MRRQTSRWPNKPRLPLEIESLETRQSAADAIGPVATVTALSLSGQYLAALSPAGLDPALVMQTSATTSTDSPSLGDTTLAGVTPSDQIVIVPTPDASFAPVAPQVQVPQGIPVGSGWDQGSDPLANVVNRDPLTGLPLVNIPPPQAGAQESLTPQGNGGGGAGGDGGSPARPVGDAGKPEGVEVAARTTGVPRLFADPKPQVLESWVTIPARGDTRKVLIAHLLLALTGPADNAGEDPRSLICLGWATAKGLTLDGRKL